MFLGTVRRSSSNTHIQQLTLRSDTEMSRGVSRIKTGHISEVTMNFYNLNNTKLWTKSVRILLNLLHLFINLLHSIICIHLDKKIHFYKFFVLFSPCVYFLISCLVAPGSTLL